MIDLTQNGRRLAYHHGAEAERLEHQAHLGQLGGTGSEAPRAVLAQLDHFGQQQRLALHALGLELVLQPLVHQPLMGGVLVDDHHALVGLGHDVGLVELRARDAQRIVAVGDARRLASSTRADRPSSGAMNCIAASARPRGTIEYPAAP